jgi:hypothetical protein
MSNTAPNLDAIFLNIIDYIDLIILLHALFLFIILPSTASRAKDKKYNPTNVIGSVL